MRNIKCKGCANLKNEWCDKKNDSPDPELERDCQYYWELTNARKIRSMTDEELAKWLCFRIECYGEEDPCPAHAFCKPGRQNGMLDWLQQPYEEEDHEHH